MTWWLIWNYATRREKIYGKMKRTEQKKPVFMSLPFIMTIDKIIWFNLQWLNTGTCYGNIKEVAKGQYYAKI